MFDIGFFELLVIAIVGLLVIGPEQLPSTLRTIGLWWGRLKRGINSARSEFEQQIGADDIRRQLHNEEVMRRLKETEESVQRAVRENAHEIEEAMTIEQTAEQEDNSSTTSSTTQTDSHTDTQTKKRP